MTDLISLLVPILAIGSGSLLLRGARHRAARGAGIPGSYYFAWVLILLGTAKLFRSPIVAEPLDEAFTSLTGLFNVATLIGMMFGALAALPLLSISIFITGGRPTKVPAVVVTVVVGIVMPATFWLSDLAHIPSTYISRDVPLTGLVLVYWTAFVAPIALACVYTLLYTASALRAVRRGPLARVLAVLLVAALLGAAYCVHKIANLLVKHEQDRNEYSWYLTVAEPITLILGLTAVTAVVVSSALYFGHKLPQRWSDYQALRSQGAAWVAARSQAPDYVLDRGTAVPRGRITCWRAAADPELVQRMLIELGDERFRLRAASSNQP